MAQTQIALSLGSNQGDRQRNMAAMINGLQGVLMPEMNRSRLMETAPVDVVSEQEWYLNRVVCGWYDDDARVLLGACQAIENRLGRERPYDKSPRTADIDILLFGDTISTDSRLRLPHPGILTRRFCLEGLAEIMPDFIIPGTGLPVATHHAGMPALVRRQEIRFQE